MSETTQEVFIVIAGAIIIVAPFIREFRREENKNWKYITLIFLSSALLVSFSIIKVNRDTKKSSAEEKRALDLNANVESLKISIRNDSTNYQNFLAELRTQFGIKMDSLTNKPVKIFNTRIEKAGVVNIGN